MLFVKKGISYVCWHYFKNAKDTFLSIMRRLTVEKICKKSIVSSTVKYRIISLVPEWYRIVSFLTVSNPKLVNGLWLTSVYHGLII